MSEPGARPAPREVLVARLNRTLHDLDMGGDAPSAVDHPEGISAQIFRGDSEDGSTFDCVVALFPSCGRSLEDLPVGLYRAGERHRIPFLRQRISHRNQLIFRGLPGDESFELAYCPGPALTAGFLEEAREKVSPDRWRHLDPVLGLKNAIVARAADIVAGAAAERVALDGGSRLVPAGGRQDDPLAGWHQITPEGARVRWLVRVERALGQRAVRVRLLFESEDLRDSESLWRFEILDGDRPLRHGYVALLPFDKDGTVVYRGSHAAVLEGPVQRPGGRLEPPAPVTVGEQMSLSWSRALTRCWEATSQGAAWEPSRLTVVKEGLGLAAG